jgi:ubiquinone/menaquinone biosynthesis C-methylase UbiE
MKMNRIEKLSMNNPFRAMIQRRYEAPLLEKMGGRVEGMRVLETGCGRGIGTELLFKRFGAKEVHALDVDPDMIAKAQRRLSAYPPERLKLAVGDVTALDAEDGTYDAVFDFWIIHHVPDWQKAVSEISRVLKPGGRFFFQEVTKHALNRLFYRLFLDHPTENRFSGAEFVSELERNRIAVENNIVERFFGDFLFGVGFRAK